MVVFSILFTTLFCLSIYNLIFSQFFILPARYTVLIKILFTTIKELGRGVYSHFFSAFIITLLFLNLAGNIPGFSIPTLFYYFTCSLSLIIWIRLILVVRKTQLKSFIAHILPYGSPIGLILLLPLIEIFSHIIRPFTLIIRLSTNLRRGHILLYIFSFFSLSSFGLTLRISLVLVILFLLELIISGLQAYIFTSLAYIYISETEWSSGR